MASIDQLKQRVDLHELAETLGLVRPGGDKGNYKAPGRADKNPSLTINSDKGAWYDHTEGEGGSCIDLVCRVKDYDLAEAIRFLHDFTGLAMDKPVRQGGAPAKKALHEWIADRCLGLSPDPSQLEVAEKATAYLSGRKISEKAISAALKAKTLGFNTYTNAKVDAGEYGHGGPAVAFVARSINTAHIAAVEMRYLDKDLNPSSSEQCLKQPKSQEFIS